MSTTVQFICMNIFVSPSSGSSVNRIHGFTLLQTSDVKFVIFRLITSSASLLASHQGKVMPLTDSSERWCQAADHCLGLCDKAGHFKSKHNVPLTPTMWGFVVGPNLTITTVLSQQQIENRTVKKCKVYPMVCRHVQHWVWQPGCRYHTSSGFILGEPWMSPQLFISVVVELFLSEPKEWTDWLTSPSLDTN